ncbi:MAG TPA: PEP-CTERM sorting domain-containing protein [Tepidisphaeraceae bacterium]|jgi:hypothetical protein
MSSQRVRRTLAVAVGVGVMAAVQQGSLGGVSYDLRFSGAVTGNILTAHQAKAVPGNMYEVELWARVSGTNGTTSDEGIQFSWVKLLSTQSAPGSGAILSGGITGFAATPEFQSFTGTSPAHRNGSGADLNGDGVIDWGSSSTSNSDTNYAYPRQSGIVNGGGTVGQAVDANTWEFKLATFTVSVGTVGAFGESTRLDMVKPNATSAIALNYAFAKVDGGNFFVTNQNQQGAYAASTGVEFVVPEPSVVGLIGAAAAVGLVRRTRSSKP